MVVNWSGNNSVHFSVFLECKKKSALKTNKLWIDSIEVTWNEAVIIFPPQSQWVSLLGQAGSVHVKLLKLKIWSEVREISLSGANVIPTTCAYMLTAVENHLKSLNYIRELQLESSPSLVWSCQRVAAQTETKRPHFSRKMCLKDNSCSFMWCSGDYLAWQ